MNLVLITYVTSLFLYTASEVFLEEDGDSEKTLLCYILIFILP